ncbi:response regulator transcription factor [Sphingomonas montanisoli]|nr:response regulator [Sphingomonas montanisoli]
MTDCVVHIVDDDEVVLHSAACLVEAAGYTVRCYTSGRHLLDLADLSGVILLDIDMPDLDGLAVQRALASRLPALPVIFLTGHGDDIMEARALEAGAIGFIAKPVHQEVLLNAIAAGFEAARQARRSHA